MKLGETSQFRRHTGAYGFAVGKLLASALVVLVAGSLLGRLLDPTRPFVIPDFSLADHDGGRLTRHDLLGLRWLAIVGGIECAPRVPADARVVFFTNDSDVSRLWRTLGAHPRWSVVHGGPSLPEGEFFAVESDGVAHVISDPKDFR